MFLKVADFLHFWRVNGWYLGVKDDNNAALDVGICKQCRDRCFLIFFVQLKYFPQNVEETREMAKLVLEKILKPCMS